MGTSPDFARHWFTARGWKPFVFQKQVWAAIKNGQSGLLHASTGAGKTYAVWFGALDRFARAAPAVDKPRKRKPVAEPLTVLWITPMRALAADTARALEAPLHDLQIPWSIGLRTGDTSSSERARAEPAPAHRTDHHPRKPDPDAGPRRCVHSAVDLAHGGGRRMARIARQQARRATATGPRAPAPLASRV